MPHSWIECVRELRLAFAYVTRLNSKISDSSPASRERGLESWLDLDLSVIVTG